jgi:DNA-directed RNA polymerase subunit N (RpoN/RPB10)
MKMVTIPCSSCGHNNEFGQPQPFHAGFGNQGFLYNDQGNLTLIWSSFDPAYEAIVGKKHPWTLTFEQQRLLENALSESPRGGRWRFANPARCFKCASPISGSITETIYYLRYPDSVDADNSPEEGSLKDFIVQESL